MSASQTQSLDERAHWQLRAVLLLAIVAAIFLVRELVGSRSLRIAPEPQRIALVDAPQQQPPTRDELPIQPAVPEEQAAPPSDGMDNTPTLGDLGPSPIDDQLGVDSDAQAGFDNFGLRAKRGGRDLALDLGKPERAFGGGGVPEGSVPTRLLSPANSSRGCPRTRSCGDRTIKFAYKCGLILQGLCRTANWPIQQETPHSIGVSSTGSRPRASGVRRCRRICRSRSPC